MTDFHVVVVDCSYSLAVRASRKRLEDTGVPYNL